ncbi:peptidoglycan bridge formation glycyltransferase FemA/FemB family protein [Candidatus Gottesmanbacteria bacterium]|nr:peptidoglycan bridge formation glycyltransferase FemA/FemB family protein [Candidatus Gottesmanbacteria bacterium]
MKKIHIQSIIDKSTWDEFMMRFGKASLFQSFEWGEVEARMGIPLSRHGLFEGNTLVGVFQIAVMKSRRGIFLHVRHGPVLSSQSEDYWDTFISYMKDMGKRENAYFFRVNPMIFDSEEQRKMLRDLGFRPSPIHAMDAEYCLVLDITKSEEELLSSMRKTTRYEIRKADSLGVKVSHYVDKRHLDHFFDLYKKTALRHEFVPHSGIREEFDVFVRDGKAVYIEAQYGSEILAGAIILFYMGQAIYHHGASIPSKIPAAYAIQWAAIREAKKRECTRYNFWGIAPEDKKNHPWRGITGFKYGFGGVPESYMHAHDFPLDIRYSISYLIETVRRIKKGY